MSKDYLGFSLAHFITFSGHQCESLHGHNYRIGVTVEGDVDPECAFVVDFGVIKRIVSPLAQAMDHKVLLPTGNTKLVLRQDGEQMTVEYLGAPRFAFRPRTWRCSDHQYDGGNDRGVPGARDTAGAQGGGSDAAGGDRGGSRGELRAVGVLPLRWSEWSKAQATGY